MPKDKEGLVEHVRAGLRLAHLLSGDVPISTQARDTLNHADDALAELEAENARLREDVIEECAKVCQQVANETASMFPNHNLIAERIRALAARQSLGEPKP